MPLWAYTLLIIFGFRLILYLNRKGYFERRPRQPAPTPIPRDMPDKPVAFGNKSMWLTVPTTDPRQLAEDLGLRNIEPCNWHYGVWRSNNDETFITPPVDGYCMVIGGLPYPDIAEESGRLKTLLQNLSLKYGRAFYFGSYISFRLECWFRAEEGKMIRSFVHADGQSLIDEGQPLDGEVDIATRCPAEQVAANWCVNPATLETRTDLQPGMGLLGELPHQNLPAL